MIKALEETVARAICLSKQQRGDTAAVAVQYVDTFWRDYLPEARIAVATLLPLLAKPASSPAAGDVREAFETCAAICKARADYFDRASGYREWTDAARSYRATAKEIRERAALSASTSAAEPVSSEAALREALTPFGEFAQTLREWRCGDGKGNSYQMQPPWPRHRPVLQRDYPHESDRKLTRFRALRVEDFERAAELLGLAPC